MSLIYLVRHAKPAATWGEAVDPGLDDLGRTQAKAAAEFLNTKGPVPIYTSPLKRCQETSMPLCERWNTKAQILAAVAEIPSPPLSPVDKQKWLHAGMLGSWAALQASAPPNSPDYSLWRSKLIEALLGLNRDCVIFSHYIAINVAVGAAQGHDRVLSFKPGHASVTTLATESGRISIRELGQQVDDGPILLGK